MRHFRRQLFVLIIAVTFIVNPSLNVFASDTFVDNSQATFNGTYSNTQWSASRSGIAPTNANSAGIYTSDIKTAPASNTTWEEFEWEQDQRYGVGLPNNQGVETQYSAKNVSMTNNLTLLHFDNAVGSQAYPDSSGNNASAVCGVSCPAYVTNGGVFGNSIIMTKQVSDYLNLPNSVSVAGRTNYSITFWAKPDAIGNSSTIYYEPRNQSTNEARIRILLKNKQITVEGTSTDGTSSEYGRFPVNLSNQSWYHVVITFDTNTDQIHIIVNGVGFQINTNLNQFPNTLPSAFPRIGNDISTNTDNAYRGELEEFAIFGRTLSVDEAQTMFRRGAYQIKLRARSCSNNTCANTSFVGPGGTTSSTDYFVDNSVINQSPLFTLNQSAFQPNGYFQYQIYYDTLSNIGSTLAPFSLVKNVTIRYEGGVSLSFSIRDGSGNQTSICDLGEASTSTTKTCSYYLAVRTNASQGYIVYLKSSGGLSSQSYTMSDAQAGTSGGSTISASTAGTEKYGILLAPNNATGGTVSIYPQFVSGLNSVNSNVTTTSNFAQSTGPNVAAENNNTYSIGVEHRLNISEITPSSSYTQRITYSIVPRF